ncbi:hypothetical protein B0T25DRAFT_611009 [Lasiosphaeria hispida]|uniref:DUF676 domain-containing protein n=1 Tax=Lasiosphaeria hispida TaxID=260671 RepID=A0AAJ0MCT8_9PEZI|nr:hypothetical protein B0T25DRAFT_611009 [Lasiosphaeria hispida]
MDKADITVVEQPQVAGNNDGRPQPLTQIPSLRQTSQPNTADGGTGKGPGARSMEVEREVTRESLASSITQAEWAPGFAYIDGDIDGTGYNETGVDIITVPCPGADPVQTWTCDPLPDDYFGSPATNDPTRLSAVAMLAADTPLSPAITHSLPKAGHMWVRQGIRQKASTARVLLYRHRALSEGTNLEGLARDLLDQVQQHRQGTRPSRPLFFVAHSIGGLVVKRALLLATQMHEYREIKWNCHGVVFFATPHRGSSYMSMKNLKDSIQQLLRLQRPLPKSLTDEVRVGNPSLLSLQDQFIDIASELRVWTFYETIDSPLSGSSAGLSTEVQFGAPLVSIKSALLDLRHEDVFSVDSDHAHLASFGLNNVGTMATFLKDLTAAIIKAEKLSKYIHTPLKLKEHVKVEVIGFYEDPDREIESTIRLYATRYHLGEFLEKGPERCLAERLSRVTSRRQGSSHQNVNRSTLASSAGRAPDGSGGLSVWNNVQKLFKAPTTSDPDAIQASTGVGSPDIIITSSSARPSLSLHGRPTPIPTRMVEGHGHSSSAPTLPTADTRPSSSDSSGSSGASTASEPAMQLSTIDVANFPKAESREPVLTAKQLEERFHQARYVIRDPAAGFSRPDPNLRKFMWIHTPFTNPVWVKNIFDKLSETHNHNFSRLFNQENWGSKHIQSSHSQAQPSYLKPACNLFTADAPTSPWPPSSVSGRSVSGTSPSCLSLYLPYLHFDTYQSIVRRRNLIKRRLAHGRATPVPQKIADLESLELRVIWEHIGYDPPINCRRTLDQFGYPSLQDTSARDDDQMLYKLTKQAPLPLWSKAPLYKAGSASRRSLNSKAYLTEKEERCDSSSDLDTEYEEEADLRDGNLLMIDQLWLWAIDTTTLATFFPKRESDPREGTLFRQADLRDSIYNELNGDLTGRTENALDLAAFTALHAVTVFLERSSHPDLEIFRIFEEAIGLLAERMTMNMKHFRLQTFKPTESEDESEDTGTDSDEENSPAAIKRRHKRELERAERENRENTSALLELRDLEDELNTLSKLFDTQEATIKTMNGYYTSKDLMGITVNGQAYLADALECLTEYKQQANEMLKRVDTVRKDYEKMLEIAQRQAQVDEVRWSRLQTELASSQNLSVMIFTTFTVIFLPLSFFTGLFGVNAAEWRDEKMPSLKLIGAISLPSSALLVILSLVAAYNWRAQSVVRSTFRHTKEALQSSASLLGKLEPKSRRQQKLKLKREERRKRKADQARKNKDRSYDFWATVKKGRSAQYQIPHLNRHGS